MRDTLRPDDRIVWDEYVQLEVDGVRREAVGALQRFVDRLKSYSEDERRRFALLLVDAVRREGGSEFPIRHPLWNEVVLPVLLERYDRNEPGSARSLLRFRHQLHGGSACAEQIGDRDVSDWALVDQAITQEPNARDLRERWLAMRADWFEYAIHEVPSGVLLGQDGASVAGCDDLLAELSEFEVRAEALGVRDQHGEAIREWRYYFAGYREYLVHSEDYASFADFLSSHPMSAERT
ncbi:MAG: hypothetical protein H6718_19980 [Polyangiaceae bacterium]|nr:hypothetical protein [Polyangiaceae bacterium]